MLARSVRLKPDATNTARVVAQAFRPALTGLVALLAILLAPSAAPRAQESPLLAAMHDELKRSMSELRLKDQPPPYFIAYHLEDATGMRVSARLGAIVEDGSGRGRTFRVEVRVGDYAFDNSRFLSFEREAGIVGISAEAGMIAPLDDDYDNLRRQIWLATDAAYKRAVNVFARKKAAYQNRTGTDPIPDFSRETPTETVLPILAPGRPGPEWADRARQISAVFASSPEVEASDVTISETRGTHYYLNSEGFKVISPIQSAMLRVQAETQVADGMVLRDGFSVVENSLRDLPPLAENIARARQVASRLTAVRAAPVGEEFTGPVLVEGDASAELLAHAFVPLLVAERAPDADNPRMTMAAQAAISPFLTRVGARVFADGFSVRDTPSLKQFGGKPVAGAYVVDDEGVPAKDVNLVENGRLLTLLTGRIPQKNFTQSNGHGRGGSAQAGVVEIRSARAVPAAELKTKYLELLKAQNKPFGYIVRALGDAQGPGDAGGAAGPVIIQLTKVMPDGREEPVRGVRFGSIPWVTFKDIVLASEERTLYNYRAASSGAFVAPGASGSAVVSLIAPSMIFEELEIQRIKDIVQKPPTVPSPLRQ